MKTQTSKAAGKIPLFKSDEAAAAYFDSNSVAGIWDDMEPVPPARTTAKLSHAIRQRKAKEPVSLRLEQQQIVAARKVAAAKSIGYQTQLRMWIAEGIRRDSKKAS